MDVLLALRRFSFFVRVDGLEVGCLQSSSQTLLGLDSETGWDGAHRIARMYSGTRCSKDS
eukprot:6520378-Pyramimonas_sp.AAC.1